MPDPNIEILKKDTLLALLENSVGSRMFNSLIVRKKDTGEKKDILEDGEYSCAFFTSNILRLFDMYPKTVATVSSLFRDVSESGAWKPVSPDAIEAGDVLFWKKTEYADGSGHAHVGFAISSTDAISTNYRTKSVARHPINNRPLECVFRFNWSGPV